MACALPNAISACADGCYIAACQFGYDDCDAMTGNGCETSVLGDPSNCGACGRSCAGIPNASASCTDGNCVLGACNAGYANCDGDPNNGCEVNLTFDAKNCGGCNMPCGNMMTCNSGVCGAPPKVKRIFVSSMQYTGNLGGLTGADAKCQGLADAVALGGSYKAWLSDDMGNSPSTRFNRATVNYVLVDGTTVVAAGWTGLASGTLQHAINLNEKGGPPPLGNTNCAGGGFLTVWTSTMANGTAFGNNDSCAGWTGGNGGSEWGRADVVDGTWTSWCNGGLCTWTSPIYCVEQ
jgi:hypothetical protein